MVSLDKEFLLIKSAAALQNNVFTVRAEPVEAYGELFGKLRANGAEGARLFCLGAALQNRCYALL